MISLRNQTFVSSSMTLPALRPSRLRHAAILFACALSSSGCDKCASASEQVDASEAQRDGVQPADTQPGAAGTAAAPAQAGGPEAAGAPDGAAPGITPPPAAAPEGPHGFEEAEVNAFAEVQLKLIKTQQQLSAKAQAGADPNALNQEMMQSAQQAVEASDLSMQRYQALAERIGSDPKLEAEVRAVIEAKIGS